MPELFTHTCICGCKASFKSTRPTDIYASRACQELHTHKRPARLSKLSVSPLDSGVWISAAELALRLDTHASVICRLAQARHIPFELVHPTLRRFKFSDVLQALEASELRQAKKLLTKYRRLR